MNICTWNSQGYKFGNNVISYLLNKNNIDILCLQECGSLTNIQFRQIPQSPLLIGVWCNYNVIYYPWRGGRCNMAILVRNSIEIVNAYLSTVVFLYDKYGNEKKVYWDDGSNIIQHYQYILRGMISLEIRIQGGQSFYINNVHLPSGRTNFACAVGIRLFASYHMLNNLFYTVGDFNVNPNYWNLPRSLTIKDPNRETHTGGGTLDYMVTNYPGIIRLSVIGNNYDSDHYPVIFDV